MGILLADLAEGFSYAICGVMLIGVVGLIVTGIVRRDR